METPKRILVATRNENKLAEIRDLLRYLPMSLVSPADIGLPVLPEEEALEDRTSFEENALAKARHFRSRSGLPTLADDSGLCVDCLDGAPGVRSRRFSPLPGSDPDAANNEYLLEALDGVPGARRTAHYECAMAFVSRRLGLIVSGRVDGCIGERPSGTGGFGYDPLFVVIGGDRTYAELAPGVKAATSHRARALAALRPWLAPSS